MEKAKADIEMKDEESKEKKAPVEIVDPFYGKIYYNHSIYYKNMKQ